MANISECIYCDKRKAYKEPIGDYSNCIRIENRSKKPLTISSPYYQDEIKFTKEGLVYFQTTKPIFLEQIIIISDAEDDEKRILAGNDVLDYLP